MIQAPDATLVEDAAIAAALLEHERREDGKTGRREEQRSDSQWQQEARREGLR